MTAKKSLPLFQVGDRVRIHYSDWRARIVEFRGPLGPGGVFVYRIRVPHKPKPIYIEVMEDQLIPIPTPPKPINAPGNKAFSTPKRPGSRSIRIT